MATKKASFEVHLGVPPFGEIVLADGTKRAKVYSKDEAFMDLGKCWSEMSEQEVWDVLELIHKALLPTLNHASTPDLPHRPQ